MSALHDALQTLLPIDFASLPVDDNGLDEFMRDAFRQSQTIVHSVPLPSTSAPSTPNRSRANSAASSVDDIRPSSARPHHSVDVDLQKTWGKPIKLSAKDNPLNISVYKLSSKDGNGAWFARRSIHEGLGFARWKKGIEGEFRESLAVEGGAGAGAVRGVGADKLVEHKALHGTGKMQGEYTSCSQ